MCAQKAEYFPIALKYTIVQEPLERSVLSLFSFLSIATFCLFIPFLFIIEGLKPTKNHSFRYLIPTDDCRI